MNEEMEKMQEAMKDMKVKDFSLMFIQTLSAIAWQKMGLIPSPSGQEEIDLEEAKFAIDLCSAIFNVASNYLDEGIKKETETIISNLKINFVEKKK